MKNEHVHLRDYIEKILDEREKLHKSEKTALEQRLTEARLALEQRLAHLNEWKEATLKERRDFVTKDSHQTILERIEKMEQFQARMIGLGIAIAICSGVFGAIVAHLIK